MSITIVNNIKNHPIPLDESKIERHPAKLEGLELSLGEVGGRFYASIYVKGYSNNLGGVGEWKDRETAEKEFKKITEVISKGNYKIHLHEGGEIELDLNY